MKTRLQEWDDELKQLRTIGRALDGKGPLPHESQPMVARTGPAILIGLAAFIAIFAIYLHFHNRPEPAPSFNLAEAAKDRPRQPTQQKTIIPQKAGMISKTIPIQAPVTFTSLNPTEPTPTKAAPVIEKKANLWEPSKQATRPVAEKPTEEGTRLTRTLAEIHEELWPTVKP